jgi:hypothetical protein
VKELLSFFYSTVIAVVSFAGVTKVVSRLSTKRYTEAIQATEEYMTTRQQIDQSFQDEWARLKPYAEWMELWLAWKHDRTGRHSIDITDEEIDDLIADCSMLVRSVKRARRYEHRMLKKLSSRDKAAIGPSHNEWHRMYRGARHFVHTLRTARLNQCRRTVK